MARSFPNAEQSPSPRAGRSRAAELLWVAVAASAVVVLLFPTTGVLGRLFAAAILLAIVVSLLILDRAKLSGLPAHRTPDDQDVDSLKAQNPTCPAVRCSARADMDAVDVRSTLGRNWSGFPTSLGPFNPDDGLDLDVSPHFARLDDELKSNTFPDSTSWD